jgi:hypothetical protein
MRRLLPVCEVAGIFTAMTRSLAHEPRSQEQIAATTDLVRDVLGAAALAAYLHGSAVAAAFVPALGRAETLGDGTEGGR